MYTGRRVRSRRITYTSMLCYDTGIHDNRMTHCITRQRTCNVQRIHGKVYCIPTWYITLPSNEIVSFTLYVLFFLFDVYYVHYTGKGMWYTHNNTRYGTYTQESNIVQCIQWSTCYGYNDICLSSQFTVNNTYHYIQGKVYILRKVYKPRSTYFIFYVVVSV